MGHSPLPKECAGEPSVPTPSACSPAAHGSPCSHLMELCRRDAQRCCWGDWNDTGKLAQATLVGKRFRLNIDYISLISFTLHGTHVGHQTIWNVAKSSKQQVAHGSNICGTTSCQQNNKKIDRLADQCTFKQVSLRFAGILQSLMIQRACKAASFPLACANKQTRYS